MSDSTLRPQQKHWHHSRHRSRGGRLWLVAIFIALRAGDAALLKFAFHPLNEYPVLKGLSIGSIAWTTLLLIAIWRRQEWARILLITLISISIAIFCFVLLLMDPSVGSAAPIRLIISGVVVHGAVLFPLSRSRKIHHLVSKQAAGA
jgi:hypothetical protein